MNATNSYVLRGGPLDGAEYRADPSDPLPPWLHDEGHGTVATRQTHYLTHIYEAPRHDPASRELRYQGPHDACPTCWAGLLRPARDDRSEPYCPVCRVVPYERSCHRCHQPMTVHAGHVRADPSAPRRPYPAHTHWECRNPSCGAWSEVRTVRCPECGAPPANDDPHGATYTCGAGHAWQYLNPPPSR
jgi:hypothetical protein